MTCHKWILTIWKKCKVVKIVEVHQGTTEDHRGYHQQHTRCFGEILIEKEAAVLTYLFTYHLATPLPLRNQPLPFSSLHSSTENAHRAASSTHSIQAVTVTSGQRLGISFPFTENTMNPFGASHNSLQPFLLSSPFSTKQASPGISF